MVRRSHSGGFTLVELMISMAVSTIGLLGLLALQGVAIRGNMMSRGFSEALGIAQAQIEATERTPYANLAGVAEGTCAVYTPATPANCTGHPNITVSPDPHTTTQQVYTRCTAVNVDGVNNVTTVQVSVCWTDTTNKPHAVTVYAQRSP